MLADENIIGEPQILSNEAGERPLKYSSTAFSMALRYITSWQACEARGNFSDGGECDAQVMARWHLFINKNSENNLLVARYQITAYRRYENNFLSPERNRRKYNKNRPLNTKTTCRRAFGGIYQYASENKRDTVGSL